MGVRRLATALIGCSLVLGACTTAEEQAPQTTATTTTTSTTQPPSTTTTTAAPPPTVIDPDGSYAVVALTNHLPVFGRTADGAPDRPWVRLHTTRDYITQTRLLAASDAKLVLSFSPSLLARIGESVAGNLDHAAIVTAKRATELTAEDRAYIDEVFFTASPDQIERFPRYRDIAERRRSGRSLASSEYRDLQVLFNLAWTSPLLLQEEPLLSIAAKGRNFSEEDKVALLETHQAAMAEFLESLVSLQEEGKLDIATAPLHNPTLPFLIRNRMDEDAATHIERGAAVVRGVLGTAVEGFAPRGGLIDQANAGSIVGAGFEWAILTATEPTQPVRLTAEAGDLLALPADTQFAERVATAYYEMDPNAAALDVVRYIEAAVGGTSGAVVTLRADGTEPWSRYTDSGVAFLESLLRQLSSAATFSTALPSEVGAALVLDPGPFPPLPDSYLSEADELAAWAYLGETRRELLRARQVGTVTPENLGSAYELILQAQDTDWYWWFGEERSSGEDGYLDRLFREKLEEAWTLLGSTAPDWARIPLFETEARLPTRANTAAPALIQIDNEIREAEWFAAGQYNEPTSDLVRRISYTFDEEQLFLRVDFTSEVLGDSAPAFDLYLGAPGAGGSALSPDGLPLDFEPDRVVRWRATNPVRVTSVQPYPGQVTGDATIVAGFDGDSIEFALALSDVRTGLRPGDAIDFRLVDVSGGPERGAFPAAGRGNFEYPNLQQGTSIADIRDQVRDDYGPGRYSYVVDSEVAAGTYDLAGLAVRQLGGPTEADPDAVGQIQFEIRFREPLTNPWSAPAGFSHQTVDLYLEAYPGTETGAQRLLPGRVAATPDGVGWDYAFTLSGWESAQYLADTSGAVTELATALDYALLSDRRTILVTVDRSALPPGDESVWQYGVAVLANQAIPSLGIHGLRELATVSNRFRLGGGTGAANDPMLIDVLHPEAGVQEELLTYETPVGIGAPSDIDVARLARIPMVGAL